MLLIHRLLILVVVVVVATISAHRYHQAVCVSGLFQR